jgi:hypothetical protein
MEDSIIISAIKEEKEKIDNTPLKPIQKIQVKVDRLELEVGSLKNDVKIILDHLNYKEKQKQQSSSWWW